MLFSRLRLTGVGLTVIVAALVASPFTSLPYEISPRKKVHETLTLMASDCLRKSEKEAAPLRCRPFPPVIAENKTLEKEDFVFQTPELPRVSAKELMEAVRWSDDPTREVRGRSLSKTIFKFIVKMKGQCKNRYSDGMEDGLLCSSHYGPLQFWHAMASRPDEPTDETLRKMLDWAEFLYKVAADEVRLTDNYCDYWRTQPGRQGKSELAGILAPEKRFPCNKDGKPWTIGTLFDMTCRGAFSSVTCNVSADPRVIRLNALGALLHMVQDSYAQGHAKRGSAELIPGTKRVKSKFECLPISQFYTYGKQNDKKHRQADLHPQPGLSCSNGSPEVDDPILASAKVLWFVQQKRGTELTKYLEDHVFLLADRHKPQAGAGRCFSTDKDTPCP